MSSSLTLPHPRAALTHTPTSPHPSSPQFTIPSPSLASQQFLFLQTAKHGETTPATRSPIGQLTASLISRTIQIGLHVYVCPYLSHSPKTARAPLLPLPVCKTHIARINPSHRRFTPSGIPFSDTTHSHLLNPFPFPLHHNQDDLIRLHRPMHNHILPDLLHPDYFTVFFAFAGIVAVLVKWPHNETTNANANAGPQLLDPLLKPGQPPGRRRGPALTVGGRYQLSRRR
jgi:hypothetical protein